MVSTFTPNIQLEEPARGDQVGVWDTPVNNMTLLDLVAGANATISLNNSPVVLAAAQFQAKTITFNSTLTGSVIITFPSSFVKSYEIFHTCTGSSAFTITLKTTNINGNFIAVPPGEPVTIWNDGTSIRFTNFGRIGSYMDFAGSSSPNWVDAANARPYLLCDGGQFSATTYPTLAVILGSTTLPDARGRSRFAVDGGAGRISSAATGFSGSSIGSGGGAQTTTLGTSNLPPYTPSGTIVSSDALAHGGIAGSAVGGGTQTTVQAGTYGTLISSFTGTAQGGASAPLTNLPPAYIGGITMIRSA